MALRGEPARSLDFRRLKERRPEDIRIWFESYFAVVHGFVRRRVARHVSNADVDSAWVERADSGCQVNIRLTDEGTEKMARLTRNHIGDRLALVIDSEVIMTPTIRSEITEGLVLLTGRSSDFPCEEIARGLSTGR